ncbi:MAG: LLM class flavin-dependent oxidoreductase [Rhodospirillaceae bacterium]|nr:LLM class flavin-dependent oxidoreductase [Rhodospirillaceae bacterium]
MALALSVLDQSPVRSGGTALQAIEETVALAQATEKLGYHRYWLAEHHGTEGLAGCAPEILIARVAAATRTMRIGSGGVMLSHYSPLKVAENFALLATMYPGRIDLGLGRAPGGDHLTTIAMQYGSEIGVEYYPTKVLDLKAFITGSAPANAALAKVKVTPRPPQPPELWLLGSSAESAKLAAMFGLPFAFAHFINAHGARQIIADYMTDFQPSDTLKAPRAALCVGAICADTKAQAERLALSRGLWRVMLEQGALGPYPTPEEAEAYPYTPLERRIAERSKSGAIIGDPTSVKKDIEHMAAEHGVDEMMIVTICHSFAARLHSYELIAQAFALPARAAA